VGKGKNLRADFGPIRTWMRLKLIPKRDEYINLRHF
jgi:hypothetical protein